jgi:hypothetical protein
MQKISSKQIFLLIFTILVLLIFANFFSLLSFPESSIVLEKGDPAIKLPAEESLTQKFTANRDNLMKVEFLLRTPGIEFEKKYRVKMELADANCQKMIRTGELLESFLNSNNLYEFKFSEVKDSKDKTYCLIATFKPNNAKAKAIQFFVFENKPSEFLPENSTTQEKFANPLSIRPVYVNDNTWQDLTELNQRMSQYKPFFLKHYYLATISILFIILSIATVIILIIL